MQRRRRERHDARFRMPSSPYSFSSSSSSSPSPAAAVDPQLRVSFPPLLPSLVLEVPPAVFGFVKRVTRAASGALALALRLLVTLALVLVLASATYGALAYWTVPYRVTYRVPAHFVFRGGEGDGAAAEAVVPLPAPVVRRLSRRARNVRCALELLLPESPANQRAGMATFDFELWQAQDADDDVDDGGGGARSGWRKEAAAGGGGRQATTTLLLYSAQKSVRPLVYRSPAVSAVRTLLLLPLNVMRDARGAFRGRAGESGSAERQRRWLQIVEGARIAAVRPLQPHRRAWSLRRVLGAPARLMQRLVAAAIGLVPAFGDALNERWVLAAPRERLAAVIRLRSGSELVAAAPAAAVPAAPGAPLPPPPPLAWQLEIEEAYLVVEFLLGGFAYWMRNYPLFSALVGVGLLAAVYAVLLFVVWAHFAWRAAKMEEAPVAPPQGSRARGQGREPYRRAEARNVAYDNGRSSVDEAEEEAEEEEERVAEADLRLAHRVSSVVAERAGGAAAMRRRRFERLRDGGDDDGSGGGMRGIERDAWRS